MLLPASQQNEPEPSFIDLEDLDREALSDCDQGSLALKLNIESLIGISRCSCSIVQSKRNERKR